MTTLRLPMTKPSLLVRVNNTHFADMFS